MNLLIHGGVVVSDKVITDGAVAIEDNRIVAVGKSSELKRKFPRYERLNAEDCAVMPGLINTHTHAAMTLLRGYAEDLSLYRWLNEKVWPIEAHLTPKDVQVGAELAAYESLLFGCTTLNSMYFYSDEGSELHAFEKAGIRATVGHGFFERNVDRGLKLTEVMARKWHGKDNGRLRISVCPHAPYSTSPESYQRSFKLNSQLNEKFGKNGKVLLHTHIAESEDECSETKKAFNVNTSNGMVAYLDGIGVLSEDLIIAHAVHLTEIDIKLMQKYNVKPSLNPVSNLKIGMGIADYPALVKAGLTVSLGTDGPASNNTLDMFETMKIMPLLIKGTRGDPTLLPAQEAFRLATENGARALGYEDLGAIKLGYLADIVLLNLKLPHARPLFDIYNHLIYSARASDVKTVIVNGKIVLEERRFPNVKLDRFLDLVERTKDELFDRAKKGPIDN